MKSVDLAKDLSRNPWIYSQKCGFQMKKGLKVLFRCNYKEINLERSVIVIWLKRKRVLNDHLNPFSFTIKYTKQVNNSDN